MTTCIFLTFHENMSNPSVKKAQSAFGAWKSPISSGLATENSVSFQDLRIDKSRDCDRGSVFWTELRYDEGGRYVVCSVAHNQCPDITSNWTPENYSARTRVHEYGGGAILPHGGDLYFCNYSDQRLYKHSMRNDSSPQPVTGTDTKRRYADAQFSDKLSRIVCVCEDHSVLETGAKQPENFVVSIDPQTGEETKLVSGCDFYSSPRVSPDGRKLVWVQWDHPNMPWDSTSLMVADFDNSGTQVNTESVTKVAGGDDISVMQPKWTHDNQLVYIGDQSEWWNLYLINSGGEHVNLHPVSCEIGGPHWQFDNNAYDIDTKGNVVFSCDTKLHLVNLSSKHHEELDTGFESHHHIQLSEDGFAFCIAASPTKFSCVIRINIHNKNVEVVKSSRSLPVDPVYLSVPRKVSWLSANECTSHGYFYPPQNRDFEAPEGSLPPLLVKVHGGPTSCCSPALNLKIQYFTSRGFAVLDVDYRGSTGYGKTYRHSLRGNWGIYDIEDCSSGALYLARQKLVDGDRLCIDGGSAGGYTTLACLAFNDTFKAGASHYGIGDLSILAGDTHKFESRYLDTLIAPYTPDNHALYDARSPIKHIDHFSCPIAFFQGDEDQVVPPNQAEMMFSAVKEKGLMAALVMFKGEQHGFRKAENIQKALDGEFYFFSKVFDYEVADKDIAMDIVNLN